MNTIDITPIHQPKGESLDFFERSNLISDLANYGAPPIVAELLQTWR